MAIIFSKAPGKIILFGEHAVVYGQPAIAIPVTRVNATARIFPNLDGPEGQICIQAPDIGLEAGLDTLADDHPIAKALNLVIQHCAPPSIPSFALQVTSTIPIAAGMGSGAAVSVAIIRAVASFLGKKLSNGEVSDLAYEVEKIHHGTPSGIDNTIIAYQKPVYFIKDHPIQFLTTRGATHWVIADTGEKTPTRETVTAVRELYQSDKGTFGQIFEQIGAISRKAQEALATGDLIECGQLMNENQALLTQLTVSCQKLDHLIAAALKAGSPGAKLSGGGRGGQMIAIAQAGQITKIEEALISAGAVRVMTTLLAESGAE